jgi:hypothetical protein
LIRCGGELDDLGVQVPGQCEVSASYLSDALGKLVLAGVAVLAGAKSVSVGFDEEPGEFRWAIILTDSGVVRVDVLAFEELWGNRPDAEGKSLLTFSCAPLEFGKTVCVMADEVLEQHGLAGYKERWTEHEFPVAELDLLKSYIRLWECNS